MSEIKSRIEKFTSLPHLFNMIFWLRLERLHQSLSWKVSRYIRQKLHAMKVNWNFYLIKDGEKSSRFSSTMFASHANKTDYLFVPLTKEEEMTFVWRTLTHPEKSFWSAFSASDLKRRGTIKTTQIDEEWWFLFDEPICGFLLHLKVPSRTHKIDWCR